MNCGLHGTAVMSGILGEAGCTGTAEMEAGLQTSMQQMPPACQVTQTSALSPLALWSASLPAGWQDVPLQTPSSTAAADTALLPLQLSSMTSASSPPAADPALLPLQLPSTTAAGAALLPLLLPSTAADAAPVSSSNSNSGCFALGAQSAPAHLQPLMLSSFDTATSSISSTSSNLLLLPNNSQQLTLDSLTEGYDNLLPATLFKHLSISGGSGGSSGGICGSSNSSTVSCSSIAALADHTPGAPQQQQQQLNLHSIWQPAADPILAFPSPRSAPQQQQQQQRRSDKGRRRGQQDDDVPPQYATSTVFFAGVSPIATEAGLMSVFEQFGQVIKINLFRPYKTCKTSKGCGIVVFSKPSEAAHAMETLSGRFVWPGARSPIVMEWGNSKKPSSQQQQQQQQKASQQSNIKPAAAAAATAAAVGKVGGLTPPGLNPPGLMQAVARPGQLVSAIQLQPQQQQQQQQQQTVVLVPQGYTLTPAVVAGGAGGQLMILARY